MLKRKTTATALIGLAIALPVLTQCASVQEAESPHRASASFEIYAAPSDTRTVNDGMSTLWVIGDKFNIFHAPAGMPSFVSDGQFTVDDAATGHAVGSVGTLGEGSYDWYMVYPYADRAEKPVNVPVVIGAQAGGKQVQQGKDSRAHLAGDTFPVGGKVLRVPAGDTPVLSAAPLVSVISVHVTNPGQGVVTVSDVRFKAPEEIVGSFTVDVTGDTPAFQAVDASDEAVLSVTGGVLLRAGETATFFLGIKPFQAAAGSSLVLTVNDQVRTVTLSKSVTFAAGKIKSLNITLDESEPSPSYYFKRVDSVISGHKYLFVAEDTKQGGLRVACPLPEGTDKGRMPAETVSETDDHIILQETLDNAFVLTSSESGYTIRQQDGRYLYNTNGEDAGAGTEPDSRYYWTVSFDTDGVSTIVSRARRIQYNPTTSVQKFEVRQSNSSVGRNPWLYELLNDEEATDEFIQKTVPGVYDYNGLTWLYVDGTSQTSVRTLAGESVFRLFYPADYVVIQISGIPAEPVLNDRFEIRMVRYLKQAATHADDFTVTVAKVEGGMAWLLADGGTGFIVNIR